MEVPYPVLAAPPPLLLSSPGARVRGRWPLALSGENTTIKRHPEETDALIEGQSEACAKRRVVNRRLALKQHKSPLEVVLELLDREAGGPSVRTHHSSPDPSIAASALTPASARVAPTTDSWYSARMPVNRDRTDRWKQDVIVSVDLYNDWFMKFAPIAFRTERGEATQSIKRMFEWTNAMTTLTPSVLRSHPGILPALRMSTCPPIARDRLIGLAGVSKNLVKCMEEGRLPPRMADPTLNADLHLICEKISVLLDTDMLPWLAANAPPDPVALDRSATVIADRLCGAQADPIIRNAQEQRQLAMIESWLTKRGYTKVDSHPADKHPNTMRPGTFAFRMNVRVTDKRDKPLNIPVDVVVQPTAPRPDRMPILIEAKSAGDFTNTNKRRKEESEKMAHLKRRFGDDVPYALFLCGYFGPDYLGYEAAEGIDWVWEHRIDDLAGLGL